MDAIYIFFLTALSVCLSSTGVLILGLEVIAAHRVESYLLSLHQARMLALSLQKDPEGEVRRTHEEMMAGIDKLSRDEQFALRMESTILSVMPGQALYDSTKEWIEKKALELAADISSEVDKRSEKFYSGRAEPILRRRGLLLKAGVAMLMLGGITQLIVAYLDVRALT